MNAGEFEFKGINSSTFNLICKNVNRSILPPMQTRLTFVHGKSGAIDHGENDYGIRKITKHITYVGNSYADLRIQSRNIATWLTSTKWERLIDADEPDKYYLARVYDQVGLQNLFRIGEADITFECQPVAYMVLSTGSDPTWEEADFPWAIDMPWIMCDAYTFTATETTEFAFEHPGTHEISYRSPQGSKFNIIVTGSFTNISITLNGKTLEYTEPASGVLTINNVDLEVDLNGVNRLDAINNDIDTFLSVIPGINTITVSGTDLEISVLIDFIPEWM